MKQSPFFVKICELEEDYEMVQHCLHICDSWDQKDLDHQLQQIKRAYDQERLRLEENIHSAHSPAVLKLAQAQYTYDLTIQHLMEGSLPRDLHCDFSTPQKDRSEAMMLYAEYAIDFARQSLRHALIASLSAVEAQQNPQPPKNDEEEVKT